MHLVNVLVVACIAFPTLCAAETFRVTVGENGLMRFNPESLTIFRVGDSINFTFYPTQTMSSGLTESTFDKPCVTKENGLVTGIKAYQSSFVTPPFNDSGPFWFFSGVQEQCKNGMVFAINPTNLMKFSTFVNNAKYGADIAATMPQDTSSQAKVAMQEMTALAGVAFLVGALTMVVMP